jgi:hypothetical protein
LLVLDRSECSSSSTDTQPVLKRECHSKLLSNLKDILQKPHEAFQSFTNRFTELRTELDADTLLDFAIYRKQKGTPPPPLAFLLLHHHRHHPQVLGQVACYGFTPSFLWSSKASFPMWSVVQKVVWDSARILSFNMFVPVGPIILNKLKNLFNFQIFLKFLHSSCDPKV